MRIGQGTEIAGKYRIARLIGKGGMGAVWEAEDMLFPERTVAVKIIRDACDATHRDRFVREARLLASVKHPGVVQVYDRGEHEDHLYFVMECLQGDDLSQVLTTRAPMQWREVVELGKSLCEIVAAVHQAGIVHRDLKPSNVFLARYGARTDVKVLDFGIAKGSLFGFDTLTTSQQLLGTLHYMAPEQLRGSAAAVDARADVFSLGAILYECLTGERLHARAQSAPEIIAALATTVALPSIALSRPDLPRALVVAIDGALAMEPSARQPDAAALRAALCALEHEPDALAIAPTVDSRTAARPPKRRKLALGISIASLLVGAIWVSSARHAPDNFQLTIAEPATAAPQSQSPAAAGIAPHVEPQNAEQTPPETKLEPGVELQSRPTGAGIWSKNRRLCEHTPCRLSLSDASLDLTAELPGYEPKHFVFHGERTIQVSLKRRARSNLPQYPAERPR